MAYNYEYPYTDSSRYNDDWLLNKMKELEGKIVGIEDAVFAKSKIYIDEQLQPFREQLLQIRQEFTALQADVAAKITELDERYAAFITVVNANLNLLGLRIDALNDRLTTEIQAVNNRTDVVIAQNNEYIFSRFGDYISTTIKVTNFFTGDQVTLQEMFNYLASLHVDDGITYAELAEREKTVNEMIAYNRTVTDLILHGNTIIV